MTTDQLASLIFGPWGAGIGALLLLIFVGRQWLKERDARIAEKDARIVKLETQADKSEQLLEVAVAGWREQTAASAKSADGNEKSATAIEAIKDQLAAEAAERRTSVVGARRRST